MGLIKHAHVKESDHLVTLAQESWDTDQVLFARGLLPRDWLPASELAECLAVNMWESSGFEESMPVTMSWLLLTAQELVAKLTNL